MRQQREKHGISLRTIAEQTKIKASLLEGLERDDVSHWPSGIFRRAYVRSYAAAIGLDPDTAVREFVDMFPAPIEVPDLPPQVPTRLRSLVDSALGSFSRKRPGREPDAEPDPSVDPRPAASAPPAAVKVGTIGKTMAPPPEAPPAPAVRLHAELEPEPASTVTPDPAPPAPDAPISPDLLAAARVCTELGRVEATSQVTPLLRDAARILDARGLIVWVWDALAAELRPALVHGYSDKVRSQLPGVRPDADNVTAEAFRSARTCAVNGSGHASGALAVPLMTPAACAGVLAIELPHGNEQVPAVRAIATMFAAMLAQLIGSDSAPHADPDRQSPPLEAQAG